MNDITIVTAFYDIGRGNWTSDKNLPSYLHRTTDTYLERFSYLTELSNPIIVFTSEDLVDKIKNLNPSKKNLTVLAFDPFEEFKQARSLIDSIQNTEIFRKKIHFSQIKNPEYWNKDYVLVTNLKPYFVNRAINLGLIESNMTAWIDFGYCRTKDKIPSTKKWYYQFDESKIHLFAYKHYDGKSIESVVATNDVYILGAKIVANKKMWPKMLNLMQSSFDYLTKKNIVDDDQGLLLLSYITDPNAFTLNIIPDHQLGHDPFVLFQQYNNSL
jgi:protein YibB